MDKDKLARLVLGFNDLTATSTPGIWQFNIDMGNFATNADELVFIQVDYVTQLIMSTSVEIAANTLAQYGAAVEFLLDIPQYNSYDTVNKGQTSHLCAMERAPSPLQETAWGANASEVDPTTWQIWEFKQKPEKMPMRPEVLQQKTWNVQVKFMYDNMPSASTVYEYMDHVQFFKMVLTVTK